MVRGLITRDRWLDISSKTRLPDEQYPVLTPRLVSIAIRIAKRQGWVPDSSESTFELQLGNDQLFSGDMTQRNSSR